MRKVLVGSLLLIFSSPCWLFAQPEPIDAAMMRRIREEGLQHSQVSFIAHNMTDVSGSRLTNSPGFRRAASWIIATLKQWGLYNPTLEPWGTFGYGWSVDRGYVAMLEPYYTSLIAYPAPWSGSTSGPVKAKVVMVQRYDSAWLVQHADLLKGNIVLPRTLDTLLRSDFKPDAQRYTDQALTDMQDTYMETPERVYSFLAQRMEDQRLLRIMKRLGVLAVLDLGEPGDRDGTVVVESLNSLYRKANQPALPEVVLSKEAYLRMQRLLASGRRVTLELDIRTKLYAADMQGHNLVAEIPGTDPKLKEELVLLGGHLDSWQAATGATDNAAGCIAAIEAVRILQALHIKPRRTIRICLWDGEEQGLFGSFHYVKNHFGDPEHMQIKPAQAKVSAYYNLDNGTGKIRGIFAQSNAAVVPLFKAWLEPFQDLGATAVSLHNTGSTDHLSFDAVGIPGFEFIQDSLDYETRTHHSNMDDYDHLRIDDLAQAATIIAAFVYNTAMRDEKLPRKPLPKPEKFLWDVLY
jgi:carboxypeptidase Q